MFCFAPLIIFYGFFFIHAKLIIQEAFPKHSCTRHGDKQLEGDSEGKEHTIVPSRSLPSRGKKERGGKMGWAMVSCTKKVRSSRGKEVNQVRTQILAQTSSLFLECQGSSKEDEEPRWCPRGSIWLPCSHALPASWSAELPWGHFPWYSTAASKWLPVTLLYKY